MSLRRQNQSPKFKPGDILAWHTKSYLAYYKVIDFDKTLENYFLFRLSPTMSQEYTVCYTKYTVDRQFTYLTEEEKAKLL